MPELPEVSPGEIIASEFTNDVARRTVQRYATIADRAAENPTPEPGDMAYMDAEGGSPARVAFFDGSAWLGIGSGTYLRIDGTEAMTGTIKGPNATAADPTYGFTAAPGVGMFLVNATRIGVSVAGVEVFRMSDLQARGVDGTEALPAFSFLSAQSWGMYKTSGSVGLAVGGVRAASFSATVAAVPASYDATTGVAANVNTASAGIGQLRRSTSARKYKSNIEEAPQLADLELVPVTFHRDDDDMDFIGFIADDMPDERAITRDDDGEVENYDTRAVIAILAAKINRLEVQIADLTTT